VVTERAQSACIISLHAVLWASSKTFHVRVGSGVDSVGQKLHRPNPGSHADGELHQTCHLSYRCIKD